LSPKIKILFVISEVADFLKTGGLADVGKALPIALKEMGVDVRIFLPYYPSIESKNPYEKISDLRVPFNMSEKGCRIFEADLNGIPVYLLEHHSYYSRKNPYDDGTNEYHDNAERFGFFSRAALSLCKALNFAPDIIHCNDWQSSLLPYYLRKYEYNAEVFQKTKTVLTIHNGAFQGKFSASHLHTVGIQSEDFHHESFEDHGAINYLKGGIFWADKVNTVSLGYAQELLNYPGSHGLENLIKAKGENFSGILNGCDYNDWNPATDPHIPRKYHTRYFAGKSFCKKKMQEHFQLTLDKSKPIFGIVSRLSQQKGFDYLLPALWNALKWDIQIVALGTGEKLIEEEFQHMREQYPNKVGWYLGYNNNLAHWIEAASDFFLMPSLFEPCGLNQIYSLKYGAVPIVRNVGGLKDTVIGHSNGSSESTGFVFDDPNADAVLSCIGYANQIWYDENKTYRTIRMRGMNKVFSWDVSAKKYMKVYESALEN